MKVKLAPIGNTLQLGPRPIGNAHSDPNPGPDPDPDPESVSKKLIGTLGKRNWPRHCLSCRFPSGVSFKSERL